ncbi:protein OXIDATIVE STRESS 3-like [Miscanthus floridulus]|uniref:protein OXIDATIVE STRESS 3-like n=1 Tax=Miscanthus floridulus TaxID=154761 RepID=UPI003459C979
MEAYVLFARGKEEVISRFEEQEEDIGCPSESSAARSTSSSSDGVDLADDASSSGSTCHFEMASLITHLPIKRGLSKFFDGKSQSFASLAAVGGLEDLPKPPAKRLKTSRSCGVGLKDAHRGPPSAAGKKQASRARLTTPPALRSAPRRLVRARPLVTARPAAAGNPLLFA